MKKKQQAFQWPYWLSACLCLMMIFSLHNAFPANRNTFFLCREKAFDIHLRASPETTCPDDTSARSVIRHCANFGNVRSEQDETGGISGRIVESDIIQCFNTGDLSGNRNIGGISGSMNADVASHIRDCFNSGLILGNSNAGGIIGHVEAHSAVLKSCNIGNVQAATYSGGVVGRKFNAASTINSCFYDRQMCVPLGIDDADAAGEAEGRNTCHMLADSLRPYLDSNLWKFSSDCYPRLRFMENSDASLSAASPLLLFENDRIDSIRHHFRLLTAGPDLHWESGDTGTVRISGENGVILKSDSSLLLSVGNDSAHYKHVRISHISLPKTRLVFYDTICSGDGYNRNGFLIPAYELAGLRTYERQDSLKDSFGGDSIREIHLHIRPTHLLTFRSKESTGHMDSLTFCSDEKIRIPECLFLREHYLFMGWSFDSEAKTALSAGDSITLACDTVLYAVWSPDGSDSNYAIPIDNTLELAAFRDAVNNYSKGTFKGVPNLSSGYKGIHFRLTEDIDLDSMDWEPVGKSASAAFRGHFHGENHCISNLHIHNPTINYKGFFGYLDSALVEGIVLSIQDTIIGKQYCGGIAAYANNRSLIRRCANHAFVKGTSSHVGGICGYLGKSSIEECFNTGYISGTEKVGGITGYTNGGKNGTDTLWASIRYCYNSGQVTGGKAVGGVVGNSYSYSALFQVYHSGQVWADTLAGSLVGQKSQKTLDCRAACYDWQISPIAGITGMADTSSAGKDVSVLTDGNVWQGYDIRYWIFTQGKYPQLRMADSSVASRIAVTPVFFASGDNANKVQSDLSLGGCGWIDWSVDGSDSLRMQQCRILLLGSDTGAVLSAAYNHVIYKQIRLTHLLRRAFYQVRFMANDGSNNCYLRQAYDNTYLKLDTVPFQRSNQIFRGWSPDSTGTAVLFLGDSLLVRSDTTLYATWENDGLSPAYALGINSLADWLDFRNAVNDYVQGTYKGAPNANKGYRGYYFSLNCDIDLLSVCDSLHSWVPVGENASHNFKGNFDGQGHAIDHLCIRSTSNGYAGIFGCLDSASIRNLTLGKHSSIQATRYVGGIAGYARNRSSITACANHAEIIGSEDCIGGICGYLQQSDIQECYNTANISGKEKVGGIVGYASSSSGQTTSVSYCYNSNRIQGGSCIGGLVGFISGTSSLTKTYNTGQLSGQSYTGSIVGRKYSSTPDISRCYYDKQISSIGGINGKDGTEMAEGRFTRQMTGKGLETGLGSACWRYMDDFFPRLKCFEDSEPAWISVVPIFIEEPERTDSLVHDFLLGFRNSLIWECEPTLALRIEGNRAYVLDSDTVTLMAYYDGAIFKKYVLNEFPFTTGIQQGSTKNACDCRIYPNPTLHKVIVQWENGMPEKGEICIYGTDGRKLLQQKVQGTQCEIDLSSWASGTYFFYIKDTRWGSRCFKVSKM